MKKRHKKAINRLINALIAGYRYPVSDDAYSEDDEWDMRDSEEGDR